MFQWFAKHPKAQTLVSSCSWLVFMAFPLAEALTSSHGWRKWLYLLAVAAFIALYVRVWIVYPSTPGRDYRTPRGLYLTIAALCACQLATVALGSPTNAQTIIYVLAVLAFATPVKQFAIGSVAVVLFHIAELGWLIEQERISGPTAGPMLAYVLVMLIIFSIISRLVASERDLRIANRTAHQLSMAEERERISTDLHNVLGQSLTAIALKAQLTAKLLTVDGPEARQRVADEVDAIRRLSAESLADVRAVVRNTRQLTVSDELLAAHELLLAADIQLVVSGEPLKLGEAAERAAAHVIREGAANVVHHAFATRCEIHTWASGVRIDDDGVGRPAEDSAAPAGTGLKALSAKVGEAGGTLTYGKGRKGWEVTAQFPPGV